MWKGLNVSNPLLNKPLSYLEGILPSYISCFIQKIYLLYFVKSVKPSPANFIKEADNSFHIKATSLHVRIRTNWPNLTTKQNLNYQVSKEAAKSQ